MDAKIAFSNWRDDLNRHMKCDWCIDTVDAGCDEAELAQAFAQGWAPDEFSRWFGEKYDLVRYERFSA